ncbi:MAG: waaA [Rickettsiaceae bacterium]|jgi:3-deoxy-D-manno-octulosonic-acid transferase|nr:waaA [Rickettsiaceae bacterium]
MILLYQLLSILFSPLIDLYLAFRKFKNKEDRTRFDERLGKAKITRPEGFLIWVHSASVGESKSALTLINDIVKKRPDANILITSGTVTSATEIAKNLPERTIHQYIPVDRFFAVKNFLKHWQPNLAIFVESELWPNLVVQTKKSGCPLFLVNGRISDSSFGIWKIFHKIGFNLLENFSAILAQSRIDQQKFINLGAKNIHFVGNLKSAAPALKVNENELENLRQQIGSRKFWLASSTHKGEEEIIIRTHQKIKKYFPDLLTIIAPRHINRLEEIIKLIPQGLKFAVRSKKEAIGNSEIYLADTMGELGTFYSLCKISLICGSLIDNIGGHNPFEAVQLGSVILSGRYVKNNKEAFDDLEKSGCCVMIKDEEDLAENLLKIMEDENCHLSLLQNVKSLQGNSSEVLDKILKIVLN